MSISDRHAKDQITNEKLNKSVTSSSDYEPENIEAFQVYNIPRDKNEEVQEDVINKLFFTAGLCFVFMIVEVIGGYIANSLAIMSDAAHLFSDISGYFISIFAMYMAKKGSDNRLTYGYHRAEIIGTLASVVLIWGLTAVLIFLAISRFADPTYKIDAVFMLGTSIFGLGCNLCMSEALHSVPGGHGHSHGGHGHSHGGDDEHAQEENHGHSHGGDHGHSGKKDGEEGHGHSHGGDHGHSSKKDDEEGHGHSHEKGHDEEAQAKRKEKELKENMILRAAQIHVLGDTIQSIGVIVAAVIIYFNPTYKFVDPLCTLIFACIVMMTTKNITIDSIHILMEGAPSEIPVEKIQQQLQEVKGVKEIHDLHIWSLSSGKHSLSAHIFCEDTEQTLDECIRVCRLNKIWHSTIQVENVKKIDIDHRCDNDIH